MLECRNCGAGAPVDEHFCPQCSRILALGRHGDYFTFLGLPRQLLIHPQDLERRFRELSRKFHPDYFYNATSAERLASLERSSYLNDAYRALKNPVSRIEHLLAIEGLPSARTDEPSTGSAPGGGKVPPSLLEIVDVEIQPARQTEKREVVAVAPDREDLRALRAEVRVDRRAAAAILADLKWRRGGMRGHATSFLCPMPRTNYRSRRSTSRSGC